jgi:sugar phosphate isomerase/epimerase
MDNSWAINRMTRRAALAMAAVPLFGGQAFDISRISFISDEAAATPADALAFAKRHGLRWIELREVPGGRKSYSALSPAELKEAARQLSDAGIRVSFFNSGGTKYYLPGTQPAQVPGSWPSDWQSKHEAQHAQRLEKLKREIAAAQAFNVRYVRVFAFGRVADAPSILPRVADVLGEMGELAGREGAMLLVENEASCNVGTCAEFAALMKLLPEKTFGINWDANNGQSSKERPFPEGYALLPKHRIKNVHMHGRTLLDPEKKLDWKAIFSALTADGYEGCAGLETHYFDGTKIEKSHLCLDELKRILAS